MARETATRVTDGLTVIRPREKTERRELLAVTIEEACAAFKKILGSGLNKRAIMVLVQDAISTNGSRRSMPLAQIETVMDALESLGEKFTR